MDTGNQIREWRSSRNMTQDELARVLSVDRSLVSKWESGQRMPGQTEWKKMCEYFGSEDGQSFTVPAKEKKADRSAEIKEYAIVFGILIVSAMFSPFSLPAVLFAIIYSLKKKMPMFVTIISILVFVYCLDVFLAIFGHSLFPVVEIAY